MSDYQYQNKLLSDYSLHELEDILASLWEAEAKREEASQHEKFTRTDGLAMEFPPPNPAFVELKNNIQIAINERWNNA